MELSCEHCCWGAAWGCRVVHCGLPLCVGWEGMSCSGAGGYQLGWAVLLVGGGQLFLCVSILPFRRWDLVPFLAQAPLQMQCVCRTACRIPYV